VLVGIYGFLSGAQRFNVQVILTNKVATPAS